MLPNVTFVTMEDKKTIKETEARLQADCFQWFHAAFPHLRGLLYHVPNGGSRNPIEAAKFKAMGVVAGIPDIEFHYRAKTYFFEFKNGSGKGRLSEEQKRVHAILEVHGFELWLVTSRDFFQQTILNIIERPKESETEKQFSKDDYFYRHTVFTFLYSLDVERTTLIADVCKVENQSKFVEYISEFIQGAYGHAEGFEILFTPDYKSFYKKRQEFTYVEKKQ